MLSREEVELYRRDGYLPGRRLLSATEAERLRDDCLRTCAEPLVLGDQNPYSLKRHASNRVKPYLLFPWAAELVRHASILDLVEAVIGPDILVFHTTVWLKPPRSENYVPWHQDATYFGLAPFDHITAWVALTPSRPESGCVRVIPGSHHEGQLAHFDDHNDALTMLSRGQELADGIREEDAVDLVLEPGDVSLHHTLTVHSSGTNRSDDWRIGIGISYIPTARAISGRPGCPRHWRAAPTASTISTTRRRPRPNSMRPRLPRTPTRSRATGKQRRASRRCATFTDRCQAAGGARRPGGSAAAAASRRTISRARCRRDSPACRRRALAGSARPGRRNPRDPRG